MENISKYLTDNTKVIDIGCGNGYSTFYYATNKNIKIDGVDYSERMIEIAKKTLNKKQIGHENRISFYVADVLNLNMTQKEYDVAITDRCLINLTSYEDQLQAVKEIHKILKPGGLYLMCEDSKSGLSNLNVLRKEVDLYEIEERWHNLYIDEKIFEQIDNLFDVIEVNNFSSFYYLASRIINGKIADLKNVAPKYDSDINQIARKISSMGDFGNFGPLKLFILKKK